MVFRFFHLCILVFFLLASSPANGTQKDIQGIIASLDEQIASSSDGEEKAKLCCYRARNFLKLKERDKAEQDYLEALDYAYSGWILHEYSYFLYHSREYKRAYRAAQKVLEDFPQFKKSATKLKKMARAKYQEEYNVANPPTIIMDTEVDPNRVTRHDLIRKLGTRKEARIFSTDLKKSPSSSSSTKKSQKTSKSKRS